MRGTGTRVQLAASDGVDFSPRFEILTVPGAAAVSGPWHSACSGREGAASIWGSSPEDDP